MSIEKPNFDEVNEADLIELLTNKIPEGQRLDYKQISYGDADSEKIETMKDVSSFANTMGGHLIIGLAESGGVPTAMDGIQLSDPDAEIQKLNQRIGSGIQPRIPDVKIKNVPLKNGNHGIVIRIPRSWRPPHRVVAQGKNRFFMRNSSGVYEPDVEELRMLFTMGADIKQRVRQYRKDRIEEITSGIGARPLQGDGQLVVHLIPFASIMAGHQVDLEAAHKLHGKFRPMGAMGMSPRFNIDGFINERGGKENYGYTQVFRDGSIEATKASMVHKSEKFPGGTISARALEEYFFEVFFGYMEGLRLLEVPPPIAIGISLVGVKAAGYYVLDPFMHGHQMPPIPKDTLLLPECIVNAYGTEAEYHLAVKPAFDALWNAGGLSSAQWFNGPDGQWKKPKD